MKSMDMRNSDFFMRNAYKTDGKYQIPIIEKQKINLSNVKMIACSDTKYNDTVKMREYGVHFFVDDYRFEGIYNNPKRTLPKYSQYKFLLSPDNSTYSDMNIWRQIESVAHSRWIGAYWQDEGLTVIPTISWSTPASYEFCFAGIMEGSIVAIGMIGCKHTKELFMNGYNEMLRQIKPEAVICLGSPFPEMQGRIIAIDYIKSRKVVR